MSDCSSFALPPHRSPLNSRRSRRSQPCSRSRRTSATFENYFGNGQNLNLTDVGVWLYDAGIQLRLPLRPDAASGVSPFVQAGAGAIRYSSESDDITSRSSTNAAFNYGAGIDWRFGKLGLRLMAKDYVTSLDWADFGDVEMKDRKAHNWGLTAGFKIGF